MDEGQQLSLAHGCQFYEVSAAESPAGAALAFQALLREARSVQLLRALPIRRKLGVHSVSRVLGTIFGKNTTKDRKKRPSLSIWRLLCALLLGGRDEPGKRTDIVVLSSNVYSNRWRSPQWGRRISFVPSWRKTVITRIRGLFSVLETTFWWESEILFFRRRNMHLLMATKLPKFWSIFGELKLRGRKTDFLALKLCRIQGTIHSGSLTCRVSKALFNIR